MTNGGADDDVDVVDDLGYTGFRLQQIQNPAIFPKSSFSQISSWIWIWRIPVRLQYVQSITDKSNAVNWCICNFN